VRHTCQYLRDLVPVFLGPGSDCGTAYVRRVVGLRVDQRAKPRALFRQHLALCSRVLAQHRQPRDHLRCGSGGRIGAGGVGGGSGGTRQSPAQLPGRQASPVKVEPVVEPVPGAFLALAERSDPEVRHRAAPSPRVVYVERRHRGGRTWRSPLAHRSRSLQRSRAVVRICERRV
jgi:hypothetical protein